MRSTGRKADNAAPRRKQRPDPDAVAPGDIHAIAEKHGKQRGALIAMLGEIQEKYGYLPEKALRSLSEATGRSLVDIYGVATFYRSFSLHPRGRHLVVACLGTACHVRAAPRIVAELERQLGVNAGGTTSDGEFTLETVACLGACALGPIVVMDGKYFSKVEPSKVKPILESAVAGRRRGERRTACRPGG